MTRSGHDRERQTGIRTRQGRTGKVSAGEELQGERRDDPQVPRRAQGREQRVRDPYRD